MSAHYDVIVPGAGSSGYVAAIRAAQLGKNIQSGSADNGQPQTLSIIWAQPPSPS
jgi:pyruvate/2-oxoglutarate dehydrogenase complex dihydrolipoamide dehydrogenase (E3) component